VQSVLGDKPYFDNALILPLSNSDKRKSTCICSILFSKSQGDNLYMYLDDINTIPGFSLWFYFLCPVAFSFTMNLYIKMTKMC